MLLPPIVVNSEPVEEVLTKEQMIEKLSSMHSASDLASKLAYATVETYRITFAKSGKKLDRRTESQISELIKWSVKGVAEEFGVIEEFNKEVWGKFTESELQQLLEFYETPVGRKLAQASPDLMSEFLKVFMLEDKKFADAVDKRAMRLLKAIESSSVDSTKTFSEKMFKANAVSTKGFENMVSSEAFWTEIERYAPGGTHKALAVATSASGKWTMGWATLHRTKIDATTQALAYCNEQRDRQNIKDECWMMFDGHKLTNWLSADDLDEKHIALFSGVELDDLSHYERFIENYKTKAGHKALSIVENEDGAYHFYTSYGRESLQEAKEHAISYCEEEKSLEFTGDCRIVMLGNKLSEQ